VNGRRPGNGRYAHPEREQRWLLDEVPDGVRPWAEITDRYLSGTSLRVRRVEGADGVVHKLTQKVRPVANDPSVVLLTTMYLPDEEVAALDDLPGDVLRKTRHQLEHDGRVYAIDVFNGPLSGLVLAETELTATEDRLPVPRFARCEVTDDDRFAGGSLARCDAEELLRAAASLG
jgi:CYTH domain-containing protein